MSTPRAGHDVIDGGPAIGRNVLRPQCGVCGQPADVAVGRVQDLSATRILARCDHAKYRETLSRPQPNIDVVEIPDQMASLNAGGMWTWPHNIAFQNGAGLTVQLDPVAFMAGKRNRVAEAGATTPTPNVLPMVAVSSLAPGVMIVGPFDRVADGDSAVVLTTSRAVEHEGDPRRPIDYTTVRYRRVSDDAYFKARRQSGTLVALKGKP